MQVRNVAELNRTIVEGKFGDLIRVNEALHEKKIAEIADQIHQRMDKVRVVLIAGPSSSGKTSFANRLCIQLRALGVKPHKVSLDDYFLNREDTPLDEHGKKNFERMEALDLKQLNQDLKQIIAGEEVELPYYNFVTGKREHSGEFVQLGEGEILVMEGIHGLNDRLTPEIPAECKFKIFISAITQLNVDDHNRISTSDSRLIRRIVRDFQFRGRSAEQQSNPGTKCVRARRIIFSRFRRMRMRCSILQRYMSFVFSNNTQSHSCSRLKKTCQNIPRQSG